MKLGTKSVLFGYHCFLLHWLFVARGWFHLYGFRRVYIGNGQSYTRRLPVLDVDALIIPRIYASLLNPRLWVAFMIHDLGYWGKPNMDGPEGERHPEWAGRKMKEWFGEPWGQFTLYHSRFYAKRNNAQPSALCFADKLAIVYTPSSLYLRLVTWTGEVDEYMANAGRMMEGATALTPQQWLRDVKAYVRTWVAEFKDGRPDTRTPAPIPPQR